VLFDQIGQGQFVKENVQKLLFGQCEHELVEPFAVLAGLTLACAPGTAFGPVDLVFAAEAVVAGAYGFPDPALAMLELGLAYVLAGMPIFSPLSISRIPRLLMASATALRICPLKRSMKRPRLTELLCLLSNLRSMIRTVMGCSRSVHPALVHRGSR
jgi:hypothetical protein